MKSSHIPLETEKWGEFKVGELFDVERGTRLVSDEREDGAIPLVTAGENNEGVSDLIAPTINKIYENKIGIDMFGNAFYHSGEFVCDDNILVLLEKEPLSDLTKLFVSVALTQDKYRYSYGRQYRQKNFATHIIRLPQTSDGKPNWEWMENYMKSLPYSDRVA